MVRGDTCKYLGGVSLARKICVIYLPLHTAIVAPLLNFNVLCYTDHPNSMGRKMGKEGGKRGVPKDTGNVSYGKVDTCKYPGRYPWRKRYV